MALGICIELRESKMPQDFAISGLDKIRLCVTHLSSAVACRIYRHHKNKRIAILIPPICLDIISTLFTEVSGSKVTKGTVNRFSFANLVTLYMEDSRMEVANRPAVAPGDSKPITLLGPNYEYACT